MKRERDQLPATPQDDELPGMLAVAKGVAEQRFPHTMDASVWAAEFVKLNPGADEGLMLSWFANAIMAGYDTAQARATRSEIAPIAKGWAIQHADRKRWRTMDTIGMPDWTDDKAKALVCRLKYHIERYAEDDPDDIRIVEVDW